MGNRNYSLLYHSSIGGRCQKESPHCSDNQFRAVFRSPEVLLNIMIAEHNIPLNCLIQNVTQDWQGFIYLTPAVTSMGSFKGQNGRRTTDQHAWLRPAAFVVLFLHSSGTKNIRVRWRKKWNEKKNKKLFQFVMLPNKE